MRVFQKSALHSAIQALKPTTQHPAPAPISIYTRFAFGRTMWRKLEHDIFVLLTTGCIDVLFDMSSWKFSWALPFTLLHWNVINHSDSHISPILPLPITDHFIPALVGKQLPTPSFIYLHYLIIIVHSKFQFSLTEAVLISSFQPSSIITYSYHWVSSVACYFPSFSFRCETTSPWCPFIILIFQHLNIQLCTILLSY